jgi:hypothetical protein
MKNTTSRFCYGKYDVRELLPIVQKKFVDGITIVELLKKAQNDVEKDKVAIVALLDLDDETVMHMLSDNNNGNANFHILSCRNRLKKTLRHMAMNQNNRTDKRLPLQKKCILLNQFGLLETQTVDISKMGLGVKTDSTLPFKNGCELTVFLPSLDNFPPAKLVWTKEDFSNTTRLGLKFSTSIIG